MPATCILFVFRSPILQMIFLLQYILCKTKFYIDHQRTDLKTYLQKPETARYEAKAKRKQQRTDK
uniref:Uncharacterized protein n=1 Tax=Rhizophora mucronata TaxID=61149 RepID=A0A2P2II51_RHIMU